MTNETTNATPAVAAPAISELSLLRVFKRTSSAKGAEMIGTISAENEDAENRPDESHAMGETSSPTATLRTTAILWSMSSAVRRNASAVGRKKRFTLRVK